MSEYNNSKIKEFLYLVKDENPIHSDINLSNNILKKLRDTRSGLIIPGMYNFSLFSKHIPETHPYININFQGAILEKDSIDKQFKVDNNYLEIRCLNENKKPVMFIKSSDNPLKEINKPSNENYNCEINLIEDHFKKFASLFEIAEIEFNKMTKAYLTSILSGILWEYKTKMNFEKTPVYFSQYLEFKNLNNLFKNPLKTVISKIEEGKRSCRLETKIMANESLVLDGEASFLLL